MASDTTTVVVAAVESVVKVVDKVVGDERSYDARAGRGFAGPYLIAVFVIRLAVLARRSG